MGAFSIYTTLYLRKFSKSLTDRAYTWYDNLKPGSVRDCEHLVSLFFCAEEHILKFFCAEAKFSLVELGHISLRQGMTWMPM